MPDAAMKPASLRRAGKAEFAKRVDRFVKRAGDWPAFPVLELSCLAAAATAAIAGAFGTSALPLASRALFWLLLMGWNAAKWRLWFIWMVDGHKRIWPAAVIGAVLLNLPLPVEIAALLRLVGVEASLPHGETWLKALAISAILCAAAAALHHLRRADAARRAAVREAVGPLARAGLRLAAVSAVRAEDHYCRVYLVAGGQRLVLCRFGDALAELDRLDGARIHRGAWIADEAVERAERVGRGWRLVAPGGERFPVSAAHLAAARSRGWLNRR